MHRGNVHWGDCIDRNQLHFLRAFGLSAASVFRQLQLDSLRRGVGDFDFTENSRAYAPVWPAASVGGVPICDVFDLVGDDQRQR